MFRLNSRITINGFEWSGVESVGVKRSIHSAADSAMIKMPSVGRVKRKNADVAVVQALSELWKEGDSVKIELGYNGRYNTEFEGFVRFLNPQVPLEIECEGYIRQLRLNKSIKGFYANTSVKKLLELAVKGTDVSVYVQDDIPLHNITLDNAGGTDIISEIIRISQNVITIFFIEPKKLWCGLAYSSYKDNVNPFNNGDVKYRIGYNCIRDNSLRIKSPSEPVQIIFGGTLATGRRIETASEKKVLHNKVTAMNNNIRSIADMQKIANEMQYQRNYSGFEGSITGFLEPYCQPGYKMYLRDDRYSAAGGYYIAESTSVNFSTRGARRSVEVGPVIGFKS